MENVLVFFRMKRPWRGHVDDHTPWISSDRMSVILNMRVDYYTNWRETLIEEPECVSISEIQLIKPKVKHLFKPTY